MVRSAHTSRGLPSVGVPCHPNDLLDRAQVQSSSPSTNTSMPSTSLEKNTLLELADAHCVVDLAGEWRPLKCPSSSRCRHVRLYRAAPAQRRASNGMVERSMYAKTSVVASLSTVSRLLQGGNAKFNHAFHRDTVAHATAASIHHTPAKSVSILHDTLMHANAACDVVYLECQETMSLKDDRQGFVCAMHSAVQPKQHGKTLSWSKPALPRASLRHSGIVAVESPLLPGVIDIVYVLHLAFPRPMAATSCDRIMTQRLLSLRHFADFASPHGLGWLNRILP